MKILQKIKSVIGSNVDSDTRKYPIEASDLEIRCLHRAKPFTMTSIERQYASLTSVKYIVKNKVPGAIVECGVWRGGNAMIMLQTLVDHGDFDRQVYLFDTFEGMTEPTDFDRDPTGLTAKSQLQLTEKMDGNNIWCVASIHDVQFNISSIGYPSHLLCYVKGDVLETLEVEENLPEQIALLRLDTDWYESTKKELNVLFPRLVKGGVCIIDDYGHWQGARKAVDEYLHKHNISPLIHVTDYTGRIFIKN